MKILPSTALALALALAVPALHAAPEATQRLRTRALAATCAQCHGTDGRAVEGEALIRLAGLPREHILTQLLAFRTGQRPATIMHQITRGYSQEQLEEVATYFASQR
jgi:cytochrome subunit of sulfide dehydrogenase